MNQSMTQPMTHRMTQPVTTSEATVRIRAFRHTTGAPAGPARPRHVTLVSEGTYPYHAGGVSLWMDQLIKGMPDSAFTVVALTVDGRESSSWPAPPNLGQVVNIPLWSARSPARRRPSLASFAPLARSHHALLRGLMRANEPSRPGRPDGIDEFLSGLRGMFDCAQVGDLTPALVSNDALSRLQQVWWQAGMDAHVGPLTLHDALVAADRMEHMLRPLSHPPLRTDVVHLAMNGLSALVGMTSKWAYGTPMVMSEHGVYLRERYLGAGDDTVSHVVRVLMLRFHRALARGAYRLCDVLAPHSEYNRRWQLYNGAAPERIRTMYNGIDPAEFPVAHSEPNVPTIVSVGRIDPLKDLRTLIRAFSIVRAEIPNARLRMFGPVPVGNESYRAECESLITELGLTGAATFEGKVPRQVDAYHAGHLVALTSVSEGFPYTVVESMSTGRPQVCTNVGGVSEAVGDAGFVVPPRDHAAVAAACVRLLRDHELRARAGATARQRVLERFTLRQWSDAYRCLYGDLTGGRGTRRAHLGGPVTRRNWRVR